MKSFLSCFEGIFVIYPYSKIMGPPREKIEFSKSSPNRLIFCTSGFFEMRNYLGCFREFRKFKKYT